MAPFRIDCDNCNDDCENCSHYWLYEESDPEEKYRDAGGTNFSDADPGL